MTTCLADSALAAISGGFFSLTYPRPARNLKLQISCVLRFVLSILKKCSEMIKNPLTEGSLRVIMNT